jgi:hypothetical protein
MHASIASADISQPPIARLERRHAPCRDVLVTPSKSMQVPVLLTNADMQPKLSPRLPEATL